MRESSATGRRPESPLGENDTEPVAPSNALCAERLRGVADGSVAVFCESALGVFNSVGIDSLGIKFVLAGSHLSVSHPSSATEASGSVKTAAKVIIEVIVWPNIVTVVFLSTSLQIVID